MKTVVFDFDGVIHSYKSGWKGVDVIPDKPVNGIKEAIGEIKNAGYEVVVVSTRCADEKGMKAVNKYLNDNGIIVDRVCKEKPPAIVYVDDRAICFDGNTDTLFNKIINFKPWTESKNKQSSVEEVKKMIAKDAIKILQIPYTEAKSKELTDKYRKAIIRVQKALKKQIPQKVRYEDIGYDTWHEQNIYACICPSCGLHIIEFGDNDIESKYFYGDIEKKFHSCLTWHAYEGLNNFCNRCGQALDWSK